MPRAPEEHYYGNGYNKHVHEYYRIRPKIPQQEIINNQPRYE
jgi:hypothetical protein